MDDGSITLLAALIILVAFSAFFSASETAFSSLNQIRLKSRAEDGDSAAARVLAMSEKYDKLLSTILIGNNIVNIAAASIGTVLFTRLLDPERGATVSTFVLTIVVLIFGEVTPKSLAKEMPETVATAVAPALSLLMLVFTPLTWLFSQWKRFLGHFVHSTEEDTITEGELMTMVSEAENDGELTDRESQLIRSAIEFDDVEVEEILTPRVDVIAVEDDLSLDEVADTFAESGYSRLPVYHGTAESVLQIAVGHVDWTSLPVGGEGTHCVLSGHRGLPSAKLFTNLDKIVEGDTFSIRVLDEVLTYEVDQILIVEPTEVDALQIEPGKDLCTLVTCTPYGINTHRLLVRGHRVPNTPEAANVRLTSDAIQIEPMLAAPLMALPVLIIFFAVLLHTGRKHPSEGESDEEENLDTTDIL